MCMLMLRVSHTIADNHVSMISDVRNVYSHIA